MKRALVLFAFLFSSAARGQNLASFEKVLVPVLSSAELAGGNGTVFQTRLEAFTPVDVGFYSAAGPDVQPAGIDFVRYLELVPHSAGRLLYFERAKMDRLSFFYELSIRDRQGSTHRTTLPVVREDRFRRGQSVILGLTTGPKYDSSGSVPPKVIGFNARNYLRVYDVDNTGSLEVRVRVTVAALEAYGPFVEYDLRVAARDADDMSYPFYAVIPLPDLCITAPTGNTCRDYRLQVWIEPTDPTLRYWAFGSATDNATGETAGFYPQ